MQGNRLDGRHALITGGGTGIGAAAARMLADAGARVSLLGRRLEPLQQVAAETGGSPIQCDVADSASIAAAFAEARTANGPISILVANAGIADSAPFARTTRQQWDRIIAINLSAAFDCAQAALADLTAAEDGRIVFVASIAGLRGAAYAAPYVASKHGLIGLTRSMAVEYARSSMTVNAVCPGYVDTPMTDQSVARVVAKTGRAEGESRGIIANMNASGRLVTAEEVADVILLLCKPESRSINGAAIPVDGGTMA
jgi:NAD(P)-dependent dehydrogenase (short-subunit alcohol dehydrogenase family)